MARCTASVTGRHKSESARLQCPACGLARPARVVMPASAAPPGTLADLRDAKDRTTSMLRLAELTHTADPAVCALIASHPNAGPTILADLSTHPDPVVRAAVARHPQASQDTQSALAADTHPKVRLGVLSNFNNNIATINALSFDGDPEVRARADSMVRELMYEYLGVASDNDEAVAYLRHTTWWTFRRTDAEPLTVLTMYPNPSRP